MAVDLGGVEREGGTESRGLNGEDEGAEVEEGESKERGFLSPELDEDFRILARWWAWMAWSGISRIHK